MRLTVLAAALLAVLLPSTASAHGHLASSRPAAGAHLAEVPRQLRLDFTEVPELTFTSVRLVGPDGREVQLGALDYAPDSRRAVVAPVAGAMTAGKYTVVWQMAGSDGHPVRGRFEFVVAPGAMGVGVVPGSETPSPTAAGTPGSEGMQGAMHHDPSSMPEGNGFGADSPVYVLIRWLQFAGVLLVIGAAAFHLFVVSYLRRDTRSEGERAEPAMLADAEGRAARIGYLAAGVLGVTLILRLVAQSYAMHGAGDAFSPTLSAQMIRNTNWGRGWLLQLVGVLLAASGFHGAWKHARGATTGGRSGAWRLAALGAVLAAFSLPLSGHAASAPTLRVLAILADGLHVLAASSWLGTLAVVLFAGMTAALRQPSEERGQLVRALINAFSPVALASAAVAMTTGVFAAWLHVGTIPGLWTTRYGILLLVKLAILGVVGLTGFYNWRFVKPRLGSDSATAHLQRSARIEVAVAIAVLFVTAILVATPTSMDMVM
jgi:copper transport protein